MHARAKSDGAMLSAWPRGRRAMPIRTVQCGRLGAGAPVAPWCTQQGWSGCSGHHLHHGGLWVTALQGDLCLTVGSSPKRPVCFQSVVSPCLTLLCTSTHPCCLVSRPRGHPLAACARCATWLISGPVFHRFGCLLLVPARFASFPSCHISWERVVQHEPLSCMTARSPVCARRSPAMHAGSGNTTA